MWRANIRPLALACLCAAAFSKGDLRAQDQSAGAPDAVLATVGDEPIYVRDVDRLMEDVAGDREINPTALPVLRAQVLAEIVDRRLVLAYARRTKSGASAAESDAAWDRLLDKLQSENRTLEDLLCEQSLTEADLRRRITWQVVWPRYLDRYVTESRLEKFFEKHRHQFDGTEVSVSHLLLRPESDDPQAIDALVERGEAIRRSILSGQTSFEEAVRKHSVGPSAEAGGKLGFIARHGAMMESFSRAAFALEVGKISPTVRTRFGVHLIRCEAIRPGDKQLDDVRDQLEEALARELIDKLVRIELKHRTVQFTSGVPHFKPGTREMVTR